MILRESMHPDITCLCEFPVHQANKEQISCYPTGKQALWQHQQHIVMKHFTLPFIISFCLLLLNCGSDGGGDDPENVEIGISFLTVIDADNAGNASDFRITFGPSDNEEAVSEYRVIVAKSSSASVMELAAANALATSRYFRISPTGSEIDIRPGADLQDSDGEDITEGVIYRIFILTVADGNTVTENHLFLSGTNITLAQTDILETMVELPIGTGGLLVDEEGNIYCADFGQTLSGPPGDRIYKITPSGQTSVYATGFMGASGNTFGPDGNIYQSNIQRGDISKVLPNGTSSQYVSGMSGPVGLVFDSAGNLYVANCSDNTIKKVTPGGEVSVFAQGNNTFNCPNGITIDNDGNLYVANFSNANVIKITPAGQTSVFASLPGGNNGHLTFFRNKLYVVARAANQIYEFDLQGNATLLVGSGQRGHVDGPALEGRLSLPNDLGFSPDGKYLYINDSKPLTGTPASSAIKPTYLKRVRLEKD